MEFTALWQYYRGGGQSGLADVKLCTICIAPVCPFQQDPSRNVLQCSSMHAGLAAHAAMAQSMQGRIRVRLAGCTGLDLQLHPIHVAWLDGWIRTMVHSLRFLDLVVFSALWLKCLRRHFIPFTAFLFCHLCIFVSKVLHSSKKPCLENRQWTQCMGMGGGWGHCIQKADV